MRIAVVQHRMRTHERMDLAALLAMAERASEESAQVLAYPCVPGLAHSSELMDAFAANATERAPGLSIVSPCVGASLEDPRPAPTALGLTLVLAGDACIDAERFGSIAAMELDAMVWQFDAESDLQAEALLELALDASHTLAPLVIVASPVGAARGVDVHGTSAVVYLGEIVAEGGSGEDLLLADISFPLAHPEHRGSTPVPAPVLSQRLAAHRGGGHRVLQS